MARVILDTGVLIAGAWGRLGPEVYSEADDVALPALAVAEYLAGVELDPDPARQAVQRAYLDEALSIMPVVDYTREVAVHHAALLAHVRGAGRPRGAHDLIVAAMARATDRVLISADARAGFADLPQVQARILAT